MVTYILACSIALQLTAAVLALRLIRLTGTRTAWSLIAVALVVMAIRRVIPLYRLLSGDLALAPDLVNELIGLALSLLMVLGVAGISPVFSAVKRSKEALLESEELYRTVFENTGAATVLIEENGVVSHANAEFERLSKCSRQEIEGKKSWTEFVGKEDLDRVLTQDLMGIKNQGGALKQYEFRFVTKNGNVRDVSLSVDVIPTKKRIVASLLDITDRKRAEEEHLAHLQFVENMDRVNRAIQGTNDLEQMMNDTLAAVSSIFDCDRTWLFYPCDPDASSFRVPMEITKPEYPGAKVLNVDVPMHPDMAQNLRETLESNGPVTYAAGSEKPINKVSTEKFGVKSMMMVALYPKSGKPWAFGLHQCSYRRVWTEEEKNLFQEISWRFTDALTSLLSHRDLRESEGKYRRIVDTASEGIWVLGPDTMTNFVNARMAKMLDYSGEEMIGRPMTDFMFEEDKPDHLKKMENRYQGLSENYERRFRRKDGQTVWTHASATPVIDNEHRYQGSFAMITGITDRKRAEEALRENQRMLSTLICNLPGFVYRCKNDPDWTMEYVSEGCIALTGYRPEDLVRSQTISYSNLIHQEDQRMVWDTVQAGVQAKRSYQMEYRILKADGSERQVWEQGQGIYSESGDLLFLEGFITDITERKRAVQALRESEQKLKATVYGSPIPQFSIDCDHRVVYWNKALEELTGRKTEEMVGTDNYWSAFYRTKRPCMCDLLVDGRADSIPEWYGAQYRKSRLVADAFEITDFMPDLGDGGKWLYCTAAPITDSEGHVIGAMETLEDVTSRIKSEMEIHQLNEELEKRVIDRTAQLQAANLELEAFSYSVSHDLRAPLRALDGFSRIVLEDYAPFLPEEATKHLNRIRAGALQMGRLIDDLLRLSRLGRQSLTKQSVKLGDLVQEVWEALAGERQGREVRLLMAEMPECQADPALLRQVYYNLIANALKFTRRRETATIEIGCTLAMESSGNPASSAVEPSTCFVRDNGVGFDMQFADKLFKVFQRLHQREEYEGTGIGLAIVHRIIARHGGQVWAHGELDKGATFYFTLESGGANQSADVGTTSSREYDSCY